MPSRMRTRSRRSLLVVAAAAFVLLGLPEGVLGPAWPSMQESFDRQVSDLAWLVASYTTAYLASTAASGHLERRFGAGATLAGAATTSLVGLFGFAAAPTWPILLAASFAVGAGGAGIDAGLNAHVALHHGSRAMQTLHGFFGIGATLGPLAMTASLRADVSWRYLYLLLAALQACLVAVVLVRRRDFRRESAPARPTRGGPPPWLALAFFFLYVGIEVSLGQWAFSLLTEARGVSDTVAGLAVAGYWGGLTGGRFALAAVGERLDPARLLAFAVPAVVATSAVVWWNPGPDLGTPALPLAGLALAGIFPALMTLTPRWIGAERTGLAVGYQLAASSAGAIALSALIGVLARVGDLEVVGPVITAAAVVLLAVQRSTLRFGH